MKTLKKLILNKKIKILREYSPLSRFKNMICLNIIILKYNNYLISLKNKNI
jgi:hypothetical protein